MTLQHPHAELSAYIDGALAPAAQAAVEGHVAACAVCRAHVAELRATVALVHALPDPVPSRRLVPRFATTVPAWLAPLRTVMTLVSGTAVFLFIASSLLSNITFLASGGAPTGAQEANRDATTAFRVDGPTAAQPASTSAGGPTPTPSPNAAAIARNPTAPPVAQAGDAAASTNDAAKALERSAAGPSAAPGVAAPQERGRFASSEPQRTPLLNPWLWLTLAFVCGAIAFALQRRLRASI